MAGSGAGEGAAAGDASLAAKGEWRANWPLMLCCLLGMSAPSIAIYALGQFMAPLEQEFGWTRTQATAGLSIALVLGFVVSPLVGRIVDRHNARLLALPGLVLIALAIAAFSLATDNLALWIGLWTVHALVGALAGPTVWLAVITAAFDKSRSLAIAVALCGNNVSTTFGPAIARMLLDAFGWRTAFQLLGLFWVGPAILCCAFFFFDRRDHARRNAAREAEKASGPKAGLVHVFLSPTFLRLALAIMATGIIGSAYSIHLAPALGEKGLALGQAATIAGLAGLAAVPGKLLLGTVIDRLGAGTVAILLMGVYALACILFALESDSLALAVLACILFGVASGAVFALITVVSAKVFAASVFGVVYGTLVSLTALAAAIGPLAISAIYDGAGSYAPAFWAGVGVVLLAAALLQKLERVSPEEAVAG